MTENPKIYKGIFAHKKYKNKKMNKSWRKQIRAGVTIQWRLSRVRHLTVCSTSQLMTLSSTPPQSLGWLTGALASCQLSSQQVDGKDWEQTCPPFLLRSLPGSTTEYSAQAQSANAWPRSHTYLKGNAIELSPLLPQESKLLRKERAPGSEVPVTASVALAHLCALSLSILGSHGTTNHTFGAHFDTC